MQEFILSHPLIILILIVWTIPWKGIALWKSARNSQTAWFIVMLILNTAGILEIIYIFIFSHRKEIDKNYSTSYLSGSAGNGGNKMRGL